MSVIDEQVTVNRATRQDLKAAVDAYRAEHEITEPIERVDWTGVFWQRQR